MPEKRNDVEESTADREAAFMRVTSAWVLVLVILFGVTTPSTENRLIRVSFQGNLGGGVASARSEGKCAEGTEMIRTSQAMAQGFNAPHAMVWTNPKQVALWWGPRGLTATIERGGPAPQFEMTATFEDDGDKTRITMRMVFASAAARDENVRVYGSIEGGKQTLERLAEHLSARFSAKTTGGMR
jgi:hypothetical protein